MDQLSFGAIDHSPSTVTVPYGKKKLISTSTFQPAGGGGNESYVGTHTNTTEIKKEKEPNGCHLEVIIIWGLLQLHTSCSSDRHLSEIST